MNEQTSYLITQIAWGLCWFLVGRLARFVWDSVRDEPY